MAMSSMPQNACPLLFEVKNNAMKKRPVKVGESNRQHLSNKAEVKQYHYQFITYDC